MQSQAHTVRGPLRARAHRRTPTGQPQAAPACPARPAPVHARTHLASRGSGSSGGPPGRTRCARRAPTRTPAPPARSACPRSPCPRSHTGTWSEPSRPLSCSPRLPPPCPPPPPRSLSTFGHQAACSPVDQVVARAPMRARLTLAFVQVQLAAGASVARRAYTAVGAHAVQTGAPVQAGRRGTLINLRLAGQAWTGWKTQSKHHPGRKRPSQADSNLLQLQGVER